jgi:hypothetical protein
MSKNNVYIVDNQMNTSVSVVKKIVKKNKQKKSHKIKRIQKFLLLLLRED